MGKFEKCTVAMLGGPCSQHVMGNTSRLNQPQSAINCLIACIKIIYFTSRSPYLKNLDRGNNVPFIAISILMTSHDDVIKWKHFPRYRPFVRGIHRSPMNSPHKGQWRGALMFSLICAWTNGGAHNRDASDSRRHCAHDDVTVSVISTRWHLGM